MLEAVIPSRRVYPLDAHGLTEEQIAVVFAMTSRSPEPFDEIAEEVSRERAADFHERWVLGYGHASVAEHAVVHLAVENVSRLACDGIEDNRLASYTEKSSRYQVLPPGSYHTPRELEPFPQLLEEYHSTCRHLFEAYSRLLDGCMAHLAREHPRGDGERESAYRLRLRRIATDQCREVLPAATLTNVGITANARTLEHAVTKLLSSELAEERDLGLEIREQARTITPTLIKYADENAYLTAVAAEQKELASEAGTREGGAIPGGGAPASVTPARLVGWDTDAVEKLAAALLYRYSGTGYDDVLQTVRAMPESQRYDIIHRCVEGIGPHDLPGREFETVQYTLEFTLDYGAFREFRRHRMLTCLPQPATVGLGYRLPLLIHDAGMAAVFEPALGRAEDTFRRVRDISPAAAQYLVSHAHYRRAVAHVNLRECYHLFKLRTSELAHDAIREPVSQAMRLAVDTHPELFRHLRLRDYPEWWPFPRGE